MNAASHALVPGEDLTLADCSVEPISAVEIELTWDRPAKPRFSLLDHALDMMFGGPGPPSALMPVTCTAVFDSTGTNVDTLSASKLYSTDGAVHWAGTADGRVTVELTQVASSVEQIVFLICAPGRDLSVVQRTWARFLLPGIAEPIAVYQFDNPGRPHGARLMAKLHRRGDAGDWRISAIGDATIAGTTPDFVAAAALHL